jgi:hypothetical protein
MRLFLIFALSLISLKASMPIKTQMPTATPNAAQSQELNSLNSEKTLLENQRIQLEGRQDRLHTTYIVLAFIAIGIAILSGLSQRRETQLSRQERPLVARLSAIERRLREMEKDVSDAALAATGVIAAQANESGAEAIKKGRNS